MEQNEEKIAGTNLTTVPEYTKTAMGLAELRTRLKGLVFDMADKKSAKEAKEARSMARRLRTDLEAERKRIKAPALERCRQIDGEANRITAEIREVEDPIAQQIEAYEAEQEALRLAELQAEQARVDGHKARIAAWRNLPGDLAGRPLAGMKLALDRLESQNAEGFEEFQQEADDVYVATVARVRDLIAQAEAQEAECERSRQQEAELQAMRERTAQLERAAEQRRLDDERREREEHERLAAAERARVRSIRDAIFAIRAKAELLDRLHSDELQERMSELQDLNPDVIPFDFQEFHAEAVEAWEATIKTLADAIANALASEQEAIAQREREEAAAADRQRQLEEAQARAAEAERIQRQQAAAAEEERQASLTLRTSAEALLARVHREGHGTWQEAIDLGQVLATSEGDVKPTKRQPRKPVKVPL